MTAEAARPAATERDAFRIVVPAVVVLTVLVYAGTLGGQFVLDDHVQIERNPLVQSWEHLPRYFTQHVWGHMNPGERIQYYRPLFLSWLLVHFSLFGLAPKFWHLTTVAVHAGVTLAVYCLARRLTGDRLTAVVAMAIFGLHPIHVESVAWVSGVTDPLMALLLVPAFLCYMRWCDARAQWGWLVASLGLFAIALLVKEPALALPVLVFLHAYFCGTGDRAPGGALSWWKRVARAMLTAVPFIAVVGVWVAMRAALVGGRLYGNEPFPMSVLWTQPALLWFYLKKMLLPAGLSPFYDLAFVTRPNFVNFWLPLLCLVVAGAVLWWRSRRAPVVAFLAFWLILPTLPASLTIHTIEDADFTHDRFLYVSSIAFCILAAMALSKLRWGRARIAGQPAPPVVAAAVVAVWFASTTLAQAAYWKDDLTLYSRGVEIAPRSSLAKNHLGSELLRRGRAAEAIELFRQAAALNPDSWRTNSVLATALNVTGQFAEAEHYYRRAIVIDPRDPTQYYFLGMCQLNGGRVAEAEATLRSALEKHASAPGLHFGLGLVLEKQGRLPAALAEFRAELAVNPQHAQAQQRAGELKRRLAGARAAQERAAPVVKPRK